MRRKHCEAGRLEDRAAAWTRHGLDERARRVLIAAGLANDVKGQYRENLLQKQQQIVAANIARWSREQERLGRGIPVPS